MAAGEIAQPSSAPAAVSLLPPPPPPTSMKVSSGGERDFLQHLEAYLARRDGVDKLLKISRYAAKIALAASPSSHPRLKSFESSVGLSRKAFRLGKFVQDLNALRSAAGDSKLCSCDLFLAAVAYGGEGVYYFVEQFVWLTKSGLLPADRSREVQKISAWAELIGYFGSVALKVREVRRLHHSIQSKIDNAESGRFEDDIKKLRAKLVLKQLSIVQDVADALMAVGDVRDGKGALSNPLLMASCGLLSALISAQKNWNSC